MSTINDANVLDVLGELKRTNAMFTIHFTKKDGSSRILNGICNNTKEIKGTGTEKQTAQYKFQKHNLFQCYEVQITNAQKELDAEKVIGWKSICIDNITEIHAFGNVYTFGA